MNNKIYPLAYTLAPGQSCTLHYLGFPERWKEVLLDIARKTTRASRMNMDFPQMR